MNKTAPPGFAWNRSRNPFEILLQAVNVQGGGNLDEAERLYNLVLAALPGNFEALNFLAIIHGQRGNHAEAARLLGRALKVNPWSAETYANLGHVQFDMNERALAAESYVKALTLKPDFALALSNYSVILREFGRLEEALACCDKAITLQPDYADAIENRGKVLLDLGRRVEAVAAYDKAWSLRPDSQYRAGARLQARMELCDWTDFDFECSQIVAGVDREALVTAPFSLVGIASSPSVQLKCAKLFIAEKFAAVAPLIRHDRPRDHDRIHVAYLSNDFGDYPASLLLAGLFERHDRLRFRTTAIAFGADDGSEVRSRLKLAFENFTDVDRQSAFDAATLLKEIEVDIAVDLMGFTRNCRPGIFALRPAPVQVNYLGFPGTMGADFIDYIIADPTVLPFDQQPYYTEKIVHLPDCYQANDPQRRIAARTPTRDEVGLPAEGFVFCCFNTNRKITPAVFEVWMRLLRKVEGSVLWLLRDNQVAERNLRRESSARGVDPNRLVFAGRTNLADHLARHRLADLFLDTLPYNAHTTASDALWTGLPVLTCRGEAFAGRVASSLLYAIGLAELVTVNLADYEALALKLAHESALLAGFKTLLERNRDTHPLFDADRFRRHIEAAYDTMYERWLRGEPPASFAVAATGNP